MKTEQLSEAIGGIREATLAEALAYRPRARLHGAGLLAACLAVVLVMSAAAAGIVSAWRLHAVPAAECGSLPEDTTAKQMLIGEAVCAAYPLSEDAQARILEQDANAFRHFASLEQAEDAYGIRLLRLADAEPTGEVLAAAGRYAPEFRPEGGLYLNAFYDLSARDWSVQVNAQLSTVDRAGDDLISIQVDEVLQTTDYEIRALGVPAQVALVMLEGDHEPSAVAYLVKDNIAYSFFFLVPVGSTLEESELPAREELTDWVCARLEHLAF